MTYTIVEKKPSYHTFAPDIVIFYHYIFQLVSSGGTKQQIFHVVGYILQHEQKQGVVIGLPRTFLQYSHSGTAMDTGRQKKY